MRFVVQLFSWTHAISTFVPTTTNGPVEDNTPPSGNSKITSAPKTVPTTSSKPVAPPGASFLHISDLHISEKRDYSRKNLKAFCDKVFPELIAAKDVLFLAITGDFTDGISDFFSLGMFGQQENDWKAYRYAIQGCMRTNVPVLTIRGNHDAYDVKNFHDDSNKYFRDLQSDLSRTLSRSAFEKAIHQESGSFAITHRASKSRFAFIEASRIIPAPHQYHGEFSHSQQAWLSDWIEGPSNQASVNTYIFIHYPLGSLIPDSRARLVSAVKNSASPVVYLSGHIHSVIGKQGVQALQSHEKIDELQISDFKWSGVVRKVNMETSLFVDIPTINVNPASLWVAASILLDPKTTKPLLSLYSGQGLISVTQCSTAVPLNAVSFMNGIMFFEAPEEPCISITSYIGKKDVVPIDTRLPPWSIARSLFAHWFEWTQIFVFIEYVLLILVARKIFIASSDLLVTFYFVLAPILPNILIEGVFGKPWMLVNSVAMFDLESGETVLDSDTTRVLLMMLVYLILGTALCWKPAFKSRSHYGFVIASIVMLLVTLFDLRINLARGGFRSVALSPHTWFLAYVWFVWLGTNIVEKKKNE